ncbi:hypothetical protein PSEUDO8BK_30682 [Pseudomonas sp. 8BK]|uniref:integrase core domain-containing protein n=1 Tax=Pseudomonas sp. 8BK TaxID=2653164 RepID=UPI0012F3BF05|nr:integrase core domain-containing protein [Pseudomonas sp. 8BK]VXB57243.1 hypothetical protein PSEUDO8BK_30682 [Pseudomonas sp. 8BK]
MTRRSFSTDFKLEAAGLVLEMERFFRSLKTEWMPEHGYTSQGQAEADVLRYLTDYYNHQRPHSYNGYRTPAETESLAG